MSELKKLWEAEAEGRITKWNQIRPEWPDAEIKLFGCWRRVWGIRLFLGDRRRKIRRAEAGLHWHEAIPFSSGESKTTNLHLDSFLTPIFSMPTTR